MINHSMCLWSSQSEDTRLLRCRSEVPGQPSSRTRREGGNASIAEFVVLTEVEEACSEGWLERIRGQKGARRRTFGGGLAQDCQ